jgi:hypothetical protein
MCLLCCDVAPWVLPIKISCHVIWPLSNLILLLLLSHKCRGQEIWPFKLQHVFLACLLCLALFVIFGLWIDTTAHSNARWQVSYKTPKTWPLCSLVCPPQTPNFFTTKFPEFVLYLGFRV